MAAQEQEQHGRRERAGERVDRSHGGNGVGGTEGGRLPGHDEEQISRRMRLVAGEIEVENAQHVVRGVVLLEHAAAQGPACGQGGQEEAGRRHQVHSPQALQAPQDTGRARSRQPPGPRSSCAGSPCTEACAHSAAGRG
jgi:hypothetical protein